MFCENCGKEIQENWFKCPECGVKLQNNAMKDISYNMRGKKPIYKKWWFWVLIILGLGVIGLLSEEEESKLSYKEAEKIINELKSFTDVEKSNGKYCFIYDNWIINYTKENEFVSFGYSSISDFLIYAFGYDCMTDGGIGYDFDENKINIYVTAEVEEGTLSIISYNINDDKFTINLNGKRYSTLSDEFIEAIKKYDVIDSLQNQIDKFENDLKENGLSMEDVSNLEFKDIAEYFG